MMMVLTPSRKVLEGLYTLLRSGADFPNGDQELIEAYFTHKEALTILPEKWASFVYRCMCPAYKDSLRLPGPDHVLRPLDRRGPALVHFTGHFSPVMSHGALAENAQECVLPFYSRWLRLHREACDTELGRDPHCATDRTLEVRVSHLFPQLSSQDIQEMMRG